MPQLTIVPHGDAAAVVLPVAFLEQLGTRIGDQLEVSLVDGQLILWATNAARRRLFEEVTEEVFEQRQEAYRRLA
jgi:antitoxin component of MazEF toxin-antitoxin module